MKLLPMINQYLIDTGKSLKELAYDLDMEQRHLELKFNGDIPFTEREEGNIIGYFEEVGWKYKPHLVTKEERQLDAWKEFVDI